jgi:hypothetical protein
MLCSSRRYRAAADHDCSLSVKLEKNRQVAHARAD